MTHTRELLGEIKHHVRLPLHHWFNVLRLYHHREPVVEKRVWDLEDPICEFNGDFGAAEDVSPT